MDKTQLITIAVTAVVSVIAKEVVVWLVGLVKTLSVIGTIKARFKAAFSKNNRAIMKDALALAFYVVLLVYFVRDDSPPTRLVILLMIGIVFAILVMLVSLLWDIGKAQVAREEELKRQSKDA